MMIAAMIATQFVLWGGVLLYIRYELRRAERRLAELAARDRAATQAQLEADRARYAAKQAEHEAWLREQEAFDEEVGLSPEGRPR